MTDTPAAKGEDDVLGHLYDFGLLTWHSSGEDEGPDVGLSLGLGDNRMIWLGELPGMDGWWFAIYGVDGRTVCAKAADEEAARDLFDTIVGAVNRAAHTPPPVDESPENSALVAEEASQPDPKNTAICQPSYTDTQLEAGARAAHEAWRVGAINSLMILPWDRLDLAVRLHAVEAMRAALKAMGATP